MQLTKYKALTFDVFGTLIDWETGMVNGLKPLTNKVSQSLSRDDILEAHAFYRIFDPKPDAGENLFATIGDGL